MTLVVVAGALANKPFNAGATWTRLSWILGLRKLGFQVYLVEQIGRENCVDVAGTVTEFQTCANLDYFERVTREFGLSDAAALIYENGRQTYGLTEAELLDLAEAAGLLINITGHLSWAPLIGRFRCKAYLDLDPGFTQFWHATGNLGPRLRGHDFYFTIGENIGTPTCSIPTAGVRWRSTPQPVVLEQWPVRSAGVCDRFTTVASWRGPYGAVRHGSQTFGLKVHEFRKFVEMPALTQQTFEIALDIHPAEEKDLGLLRRHGWHILDPRAVTPDPSAFRRYVQTSGAEFSVAQGIYVETQCGWFSDRTTRYLASGKPALVQDTGFSRNYPAGDGLVPFETPAQAAFGAKRIVRDYERHCRAARDIAEAYFDSDKVLGRFVDQIGLAP